MRDSSPATTNSSPIGFGIRDALQQKLNVMHAVILRDIRSRFFNHGLGFLIVPLFPVSHVILLLGVYSIVGRAAVFGDDLLLFFATGLVPALTFMYVSRFMSISLLANKSMMAFPVVRLLDIVLARAFLEIMGIVISLFIMFVFLVSFGTNPYPTNPSQALEAFLYTIVLALGLGIIASVISSIAPVFSMIYSLSMIVFYLSSGAPIYLYSFPEQLVHACAWNPLFHSVQWIRSAYYLGYPTQDIDKTYLIGFSIVSVALGLFLERILRPYILNK
ncbi:ABC transporter permease [Shinella sp. BYT-45]|uniref:ABC transporter permease n=1 Tax=Shinella sp. BYT-45 TaxID=3377377 RepID=UPI0039802D39